MKLEIGKAGKAQFLLGFKKTNIFEYETNGVVLERDKGIITMYVANLQRGEIYCEITLGDKKILKTNKFVVAAYSPEIMLLDGGDILAVVDFDRKKVAINKDNLEVKGFRDWAESPRMEWEDSFVELFGMSQPEEPVEDVDLSLEPEQTLPALEERVDSFWKWFSSHEEEVVEKWEQGGEVAETLIARLRIQLSIVFPYIKAEQMDFSLTREGDGYAIRLEPGTEEAWQQDAQVLWNRIPEELAMRWRWDVQA